MQRVTVTLDDDLMAELDAIIAERGYQNRSEAIRDLARAGIKEAAPDSGRGRDCVAALVYVYDHEARQLSKRLAPAYHEHHELSLASLHVHLDHDTCLEVTVLRGKTGDVQHFGEHVIAERGVRHGKLVRMPVEAPAASSGRPPRSHHHHDHDQVAPKAASRAKRFNKSFALAPVPAGERDGMSVSAKCIASRAGKNFDVTVVTHGRDVI